MKKILLLIGILMYSVGYSQVNDTIKLDGVEIIEQSPQKAIITTPVTYTNITVNELESVDYGQEPSLIFSNTPNITSYSDNGGSWGYSYYRLRGMDQNHVNITLNGVPMNEPEDQGNYFSNYVGFMNIVSSTQIQRGVGMSKNGVANFGGSINFESFDYDKDKLGYLDVNMGSYNTKLYTFGFKTKSKNDKFYTRFNINDYNSEGYRDDSDNKSTSLYLETTYNITKKDKISLLAFRGEQSNNLAWVGSPLDSIKINKEYNDNTIYEKDNFNQKHIQLHYNKILNDNSRLNYCAYYTHLNGYYTYQYDPIEFYHSNIDDYGSMDQYNIESNFYGNYLNYNIDLDIVKFYTGVNLSTYNRKHFGQTWFDVNDFTNDNDEDMFYNNTGYRNEFSIYTKGIIDFGSDFNFYGDVQYRYTDFIYKGDEELGKYKWKFLNYNTGISKKLNDFVLYFSVGESNREPTRNDLLGGWDNYYGGVLDIQPEKVIDRELGIRYLDTKLQGNLNLYIMNFKDEIVVNGEYGNTGLILRENVSVSKRSGVELDLKYIPYENIKLFNTSSYSHNKIDDNYYHALSPNFITNQGVEYTFKKYKIGVIGKYQSESYLDLDNNYKLPEYYIFNTYFIVDFDLVSFILRINNITDETYYGNGMVESGIPLYFVQAPRNYMFTFKLKF